MRLKNRKNIDSGVPNICINPSVSGWKSQTIFPVREIWLWSWSLLCLYFGKGILFEQKKNIFFRRTFQKFWQVSSKLGNYAVCIQIFQGILLYFHLKANFVQEAMQNRNAALSNDFRLQLLNFFLTLQIGLVRAQKEFF